MAIREATTEDLGRIREIYAIARAYMRSHGNTVQWGDSDKPEDHLEEDIEKHRLFVGVDREDAPHFVFMFAIGDDPTYHVIMDGKWLNDEPYGVIHRVASDGAMRGVIPEITEFCGHRIENLRCDTHAANLTMQHQLEKAGFIRCGIIYVSDGTERIAYHKE